MRLEVLKALIAKLPTFELAWPDTAKERWFTAFHRLLEAASKAEWSAETAADPQPLTSTGEQ